MKFEEPKFTVIEFDINDVIATSGAPDTPGGGPVIEENNPTFETMLG